MGRYMPVSWYEVFYREEFSKGRTVVRTMVILQRNEPRCSYALTKYSHVEIPLTAVIKLSLEKCYCEDVF